MTINDLSWVWCNCRCWYGNGCWGTCYKWSRCQCRENRSRRATCRENNQPKDNSNPSTKSTDVKNTSKSDVDYSKLAFITVQVGAVKEGGAISPKLKELKTVFNITFEDGYTRYFVGRFSTITDAKLRLEKLKDAGFEDAFLVAYDHLVKVKCSEVQNKK